MFRCKNILFIFFMCIFLSFVSYGDYNGGTVVRNNSFSVATSFYTITYHLNGGDWDGDAGISTYANVGGYYTIPSVSKYGAVFLGWYLEDNKLNDTNLDSGLYLSGENIHVIAKFEMGDAAVLESGKSFNAAIKTLAKKSSVTYTTSDSYISSIEFTDTAPSSSVSKVNLKDSSSLYDVWAWYDSGTVYIYTDGPVLYLNEDSSYMFYKLESLNSLDLTSVDTSEVTSMRSMFSGDKGLTSLDISTFETSQVTNMRDMFFALESMTSLDVSSLDTHFVTDMSYMFQECYLLESLDLSTFDTSNVTAMDYMFDRCNALISLDVSNFDTSKVTSMRQMFNACNKLSSLDLSSFDTSNVTNMYEMFENCNSLTSLDLSNFDTSNVTTMYQMFYACTNLISLNLSNFDTSNVETMYVMFKDCDNLELLNLGSKFYMDDLSSSDKYQMLKGTASSSKSCYIVCTSSTQSALSSDTDITSSYITFITPEAYASMYASISLDMNDESDTVYTVSTLQ